MGFYELLQEEAAERGDGPPPITPSPGDALAIGELFVETLKALRLEGDGKSITPDQLASLFIIVGTTRAAIEHWCKLADDELDRMTGKTGISIEEIWRGLDQKQPKH